MRYICTLIFRWTYQFTRTQNAPFQENHISGCHTISCDTHTQRTMVLHRATFFQANVRNVHFGGIVLRVLSSQPANESKWWNPFARENLLSTFRDRIVERSQGHAAYVRINLKLSSEKHMAMSQWELSFILQQIRKSFLLLSHKLPEDGWNLVRFILPFPSCWLLLI